MAPPPATPRPAPRPAARERLLAAGDALLFTRGVRATAVDELLAEAGASPSTLYAHFGSKDGLLAAVLTARLARWRSTWDACVVAADDDEGRLLAVFDALMTYRADDEVPARWCAFLATTTELPEPGVEVAAALAADTDLLTSRLLHLSRPLAGRGAPALADAVLVAYDGALAGLLRGRPADPVAAARAVARAAVRAARSGSAA